MLLVAALGVAGLVSANQPLLTEVEVVEIEAGERKCVGVESDCGEGGIWYACGETNATENELDHEVADDMRQLLNEAFCGY